MEGRDILTGLAFDAVEECGVLPGDFLGRRAASATLLGAALGHGADAVAEVPVLDQLASSTRASPHIPPD